MLIRIILDTSVVRNYVHKDDETLALQAINGCPHQLRISLSGTAFVELLCQLCRTDGGISFDDWSDAAEGLDNLLDRRWPFFPAGKELSALTGVQTDLRIDVPLEQSYMKACWRLLREAKSLSDLQRGLRFNSGGKVFSVLLEPQKLDEEIRRTRVEWIDFVEERARELSQRLPREITEQAIVERMRADLGKGAFDPPNLADRLDSVVRVQARLIFQSTKARDAYNPASGKKKGDAFDMRLLYHLPLPAIVVTADMKFISRIRGVNSNGAARVLSIREFNNSVESGEIVEIVRQVRSEEQQFSEWQLQAYYNWQRRLSPPGDDWTDWFDAEPIA